MKEIAVLGSTGSIGTQTLDVIRMHSDLFHPSVLACHNNIGLLRKQVEEFHPHAVVITDEKAALSFRERFCGKVEIYSGEEALSEATGREDVDLVLVAVVGIAGLKPTLKALEAHKEIALANKETLVAGGQLVISSAREKHILIRPVDSEHSAIFQSLLGQDHKGVHNLILTASGGPFRGKSRKELEHVSLADAMHHPTWNMGLKVTLDSATMFNKGLEIIEAHWLFGTDYDHIQVVVQPQSLVHSMVEYEDGSIIAQIGNPDMHLPIQFALTYPRRLPSPSGKFLDWKEISAIRFEIPDTSVFRSLPMAYRAGKAGGDMTAAFNAANEEAIHAFMEGQISFLAIYDVVEEVLDRWQVHEIHSLEEVLGADQKARRDARAVIRRKI